MERGEVGAQKEYAGLPAEMAILSLDVAGLSFLLGLALRVVLGVEV